MGAQKKINLKHTNSSLNKPGYVGYYWTYFFFSFFCSNFSWRNFNWSSSFNLFSGDFWPFSVSNSFFIQQTIYKSYVDKWMGVK